MIGEGAAGIDLCCDQNDILEYRSSTVLWSKVIICKFPSIWWRFFEKLWRLKSEISYDCIVIEGYRTRTKSPMESFPCAFGSWLRICSMQHGFLVCNMVANSELLGMVPARPNFLERMVKSIAWDNRTLLASDVLSICVTHRLGLIKHWLMGYQYSAKCQACKG